MRIAMASAGLDRLAEGQWTLHSRFSQAVNFIHASGALLTFYRYGKGMGPAGILLSTRDFARFATVKTFEKQGQTLFINGSPLSVRRALTLTTTPTCLVLPDLSSYCAVSGLCGPLNQLSPDAPPCQSLMEGLQRWSCGEKPDWLSLTGLGPGLTPSGDDMLVGAMAVLFASQFSSYIQQHPFLPSADQLALLTTSVSCSYLNSARIGAFSSPVLRVVRHLQHKRDPRPAIRRLLAVGHTSGADMLVGMVVALKWLQMRPRRSRHARSGNDSYIYPGSGDRKLFPRRQLVTQNARRD
ncbi:putative cytoplasmic protein [Trabulsiella guamensis ATCC 49490]|uniref:Putative cytoplasmic protein n=1 Tax=Trabulsiella guamensis ATCC 49490 TaxID=1005994 RepID=A0A085A5S5_9ENTR|nr:DUF2877 domain-containing protein [Trabulsiella guamensis]KFC05570.1 putative cytoplasmic protein [Trabulsiella guamensis ATCC 49490]